MSILYTVMYRKRIVLKTNDLEIAREQLFALNEGKKQCAAYIQTLKQLEECEEVADAHPSTYIQYTKDGIDQINQLTLAAARANRQSIHAAVNRTRDSLVLARHAAKEAHKNKEFRLWSGYMRLAKRLKARLKIYADWLYLSIYGVEYQHRQQPQLIRLGLEHGVNTYMVI